MPLAAEEASLEQELRPLLAALGGAAGTRSAAGGAAWQPTTETLFHDAHHVEVLVSVLLGATPGNASTENLPAELLSALGDLRGDLDSCRRLLSQ